MNMIELQSKVVNATQFGPGSGKAMYPVLVEHGDIYEIVDVVWDEEIEAFVVKAGQ